MSDNVTKALDIVDKNVDKIVNKLVELGPLAQQGAQETLSYISMRGWMEISIIIFSMLVGLFFFTRGIMNGNSREKGWESEGTWFQVVPGGLIAITSLFALALNGSSLIARAMHPAGYLVMKVLG